MPEEIGSSSMIGLESNSSSAAEAKIVYHHHGENCTKLWRTVQQTYVDEDVCIKLLGIKQKFTQDQILVIRARLFDWHMIRLSR